MKPAFSDQDRSEAIKSFIVARYQGGIKINSWDSLIDYLESPSFTPLRKISYDEYDYDKRRYHCSNKEAESYFNFLIDIVTGTQKASEEVVKFANDQLFALIHVMRDDMTINGTIMLLPSIWEEKLTSLNARIDKIVEDISVAFEKVQKWMEKYQPILEEAERDYSDKANRRAGA